MVFGWAENDLGPRVVTGFSLFGCKIELGPFGLKPINHKD